MPNAKTPFRDLACTSSLNKYGRLLKHVLSQSGKLRGPARSQDSQTSIIPFVPNLWRGCQRVAQGCPLWHANRSLQFSFSLDHLYGLRDNAPLSSANSLLFCSHGHGNDRRQLASHLFVPQGRHDANDNLLVPFCLCCRQICCVSALLLSFQVSFCRSAWARTRLKLIQHVWPALK